MSNVLDKSFIHRSYPKLAYGSIHANTSSLKAGSEARGLGLLSRRYAQ